MSSRNKVTRRYPVFPTVLVGLAVFSSLLLLTTQVSYAGDIVGVVQDPNLERFVAGATVTVDEVDRQAVTDRWGRYSLRGLPAGEYTVEVTAQAYQQQSFPVTVPETGEVVLDVTLVLTFAGDITVTGARISQFLALEHKRTGESILDAVSSDNIDKLPDFNAAEAIQRLPGLTVEIDQGEGRYPVIRGIDSNLNNVTIDGNLVGAPEGAGRRVALDVVPSDLVAGIEVVKAITPDLDGNAIGGNINIVTRSAFDSPESLAHVTIRGGYNDMSGNVPYGGSAAWRGTLGANDKWGLVVAGSYYLRRYQSNLLEGLDWAEFAPESSAPENIRLFDYDIERERIGANMNLEYRAADNALWYVRGIFNEFTDIEARDQLDFDAARGTQTALSDTLVQNSKGRASREYRQNNQTQRLTNISVGGDFTFGNNLTWGASYTFSHAEEITPLRIDWEYRSSKSAFPNTIDVSNLFFQFDAGSAINDPANFDFRRVRMRTDDIEEDIHSLKIDLRIDGVFGNRPGYLKFGLKYSLRDKLRDRTNNNFVDAEDFTLADTGLFSAGPDPFFGGSYVLGPVLDFGAHQLLLETNPELFEFDAESSALNSIASDYDIQEDLTAAYGMFSVDLGDFTLLAGVRLEYTDATYHGYITDPDDDPLNPGTPVSDTTSYLDPLPSLHVTYRVKENMLIRGAWTNTIGRANFGDVIPFLEIDDDEGETGNPDLKPFESMGLDISFERYFEPTGIFSIAVFYKDIKNPIFTRTMFDVEFRGIEFAELKQPQNADRGQLLGLELNWEQQFVKLPAPWNGLGASFNLTFVRSEVDVFGREDDNLPFFRQPDRIANFALFYGIGRFEARLAAKYRDAYLQSISDDLAQDVYFGERTQIDFKVNYIISDKVSIFGEVQNISDASRREWQGVPNHLFADEIYGWTTLFGMSYFF